MPTYRLEFRPSAAQAFLALPKALQRRLDARLLSLEEDPRPHGAVPLEGVTRVWRLRVGDYRVLYEMEDEVVSVLVLRIGHRREVHRR